MIDEQAGANLYAIAAVAIYEACRYEAAESGRPIVPEAWVYRDDAFQRQFTATIERICQPGVTTTPEAEHDSWMRAYETMGWTYGPLRDPVAKTHPDMVPFNALPESERQKDAIFLACCAVAQRLLAEIGEARQEGYDAGLAEAERICEAIEVVNLPDFVLYSLAASGRRYVPAEEKHGYEKAVMDCKAAIQRVREES